MHSSQNVSWDDLKCQYYHNLEMLQNSLTVAQNSALELTRIYSEVLRKAKGTSPEVIKDFVNLWLKNGEVLKSDQHSVLKEDFERLIQNPSEKNLQDLGLILDKKLFGKSLNLLDYYHTSMRTFYDSWKKMWSN